MFNAEWLSEAYGWVAALDLAATAQPSEPANARAPRLARAATFKQIAAWLALNRRDMWVNPPQQVVTITITLRLDMSHAKQLVPPFTTVARPMQEGLAFRSKGSIGVVVRRGANARMTQPPLRLCPIRGSSW